MYLIDTHAHLDMLSDYKKAIKQAHEAGVEKIILPTASEDSFEKALEICHEYDNIYALLGVHPEDCEKFNDNTAKKMIELSKDEKVVGIGEIGLDYHFNKENKESQKRCFQTQIEIANSLNLPIAHLDTITILKEMKPKRALLHCFSGSVEFMKECCALGYKIAIGGVVTFKNANTIKEVIKETDLKNLMLETDCPYLAPHPFRGSENEPKYIGFVAKEIANLKNISYDCIVENTTKNAIEFFNLDKFEDE